MRKILLFAMIFCSTIAFAEDEQVSVLEPEQTTEQTTEATEATVSETEATAESPYIPMAPQYISSNSSFDYHDWVDAIYVNFGIKSSHLYSLGFDIGKQFFVGYDYTWNTGKTSDEVREHRISLGVRPNLWLLKFLFFQCKIGAEVAFGKTETGGTHIDALIEPRIGVKIGSGGAGVSYRFDVDRFKFSNTITGHLCVSAFYYL